jgi:hypothetical protein
VTVHIFDFYAIETLSSVLQTPSPATYAKLTAWVAAGELTFPDDVVNECKALGGADDAAASWAVGVAGTRVHKSFPGNQPQVVLGSCPELHDVSDSGIQSHIGVASLASHLMACDHAVEVVSEDKALGVDRMSLAAACCALGIPVTGLQSYCTAHGI